MSTVDNENFGMHRSFNRNKSTVQNAMVRVCGNYRHPAYEQWFD